MSSMTSQITSITIVYSTVYSGADHRKHQSSAGLCAGNSPVTGEFSAQKASNVENVSIWWCHHELNNSDSQISIIIKGEGTCVGTGAHHWSPISLVPHLISSPSHWSPISLVPHLIDPPISTHAPLISLVPHLIGPPPTHWSPISLVPQFISPPLHYLNSLVPLLIGPPFH